MAVRGAFVVGEAAAEGTSQAEVRSALAGASVGKYSC